MANTPLYKATDGTLEGEGNIGLWFNKFCDKWLTECHKDNKGDYNFKAIALSKYDFTKLCAKCNDSNIGKQKFEFNKNAWIEEFNKKKIILKDSTSRIQKLAGKNNFVCYQTKEPMIIGMGLNHPIENGMLFHHTLGVPYLPGSSVKGLVRAWAEQWGGVNEDELFRIFGSKNRSQDKDSAENTDTQVGSVIFFDALPIESVTLKADIMTPHYPAYYSSKGATPPADNQDPNPIPFLTVESGTSFQFAFKANKSDVKTVMEWLEAALGNLGAGAKTAVGYGRMDFEDCPKAPLKESPVDKWIEKQVPGMLNKIHQNSLTLIGDKQMIGKFIGKAMIKEIKQHKDNQEIYMRMRELIQSSDKLNEENFINNYIK